LFNLLIAAGADSWDPLVYEFSRDRFTEYTADEIIDRYRTFTESSISELKSFPCLFAVEKEQGPSRVGYITDIRLRSSSVVIDFKFDPHIPPLVPGAVEAMRIDFDLGKYELNRTHWAIKDERLFEILVRRGFATKEQVDAAINEMAPAPPQAPKIDAMAALGNNQVFIVHGQDDLARVQMSAFITALGLQPIVLHEQASNGMTIIEKIEHYSDVGFGVVLYTPCDIGCRAGSLSSQYRARQNVVFEHGYLIAKLGRERVAAVVKTSVEIPNDISGVVYVQMDDGGNWQSMLKTELRAAGYEIPM
jgi:predicted nucleotide-binding protein